MQRNQQGFTLIEITAVLVLMAVISAYVIGRSANTEQFDVAAQTDRIRNQIRYAHSMAMKRSDKIWGMKCDANTNEYWLFSVPIPVAVNDENQAVNQITLPGESDIKISLADRNIDSMTGFTLFFDRIGKPYTAYTDEDTNSPLDVTGPGLTITITDGGHTRDITVTPETGLTQ